MENPIKKEDVKDFETVVKINDAIMYVGRAKESLRLRKITDNDNAEKVLFNTFEELEKLMKQLQVVRNVFL